MKAFERKFSFNYFPHRDIISNLKKYLLDYGLPLNPSDRRGCVRCFRSFISYFGIEGCVSNYSVTKLYHSPRFSKNPETIRRYSEPLLHSTHVIEFNHLYPEVVKKLYHKKILKSNNHALMELYISVFDTRKEYTNLSKDERLLLKIILNIGISFMVVDNTFMINDFSLVTNYLFEYKNLLPWDSITAADIDIIYYNNNNPGVDEKIQEFLKEVDLPYELTEL